MKWKKSVRRAERKAAEQKRQKNKEAEKKDPQFRTITNATFLLKSQTEIRIIRKIPIEYPIIYLYLL